MWGEHGRIGKEAPYDASIRIPMVLRWDGHLPAGTTDSRLALNIDVSQTILDAAGSRARTSGLDLVGGPVRSGFVLEAAGGSTATRGRPPFCGWRTRDWMYVHYGSGEENLFHYTTDPYEQHDLAHNPAYNAERLQLRALAMKACRPTPPDFSWTTQTLPR
jgi:arylsulfatase A-like enzyme